MADLLGVSLRQYQRSERGGRTLTAEQSRDETTSVLEQVESLQSEIRALRAEIQALQAQRR